MKRFALGLFLGFLLTVGALLLLLMLGSLNVAATEDPGSVEMRVMPWVRDRSIHERAGAASNPFAQDPAVLPLGMVFYRESCVMCHGAPDVDVTAFAEGLNPAPPPLDDEEIQRLSDGELFWVIKNGIRMTGMPAFEDAYQSEEVWKIVAYVRHLPRITEEEREYLGLIAGPEDDRNEENEASAASFASFDRAAEGL